MEPLIGRNKHCFGWMVGDSEVIQKRSSKKLAVGHLCDGFAFSEKLEYPAGIAVQGEGVMHA